MKIDYAEVRALLRHSRSGALGTHSVAMPGFPFVSAVPFVSDASGRPVFLISGLAEHTRNLLADPRASLLVTEGDGINLAQARLTLLGRMQPVDLDEASRQRYVRYNPESALYLELGDFRFFRLEPDRARFVGGFGRMGWVAAEAPAAALDPKAEAELVARLERQASPGVAVVGIDREGLDVRIGGVLRRLALSATDSSTTALEAAAAAILLGLEAPPAAGDSNLA